MVVAGVQNARGRRPGRALVDFAIVGSVLFLLLLGTIELGRGYMVKHLLTNAARVGCRTGMLQGKSSTAIETAANNYLSTSGISGSTVTVLVNGAATDASTANEDDEILVTVSVPVSNVTWIPGFSFLGTNIYGKYSIRRE